MTMRTRPIGFVLRIGAALTLMPTIESQAISAEDSQPRTIGSIERLDPAVDKLVPADAKMEVIGEGFAWCEGPVWIPKENCLLFSNIPNNELKRWDAKSGVKSYLQPAG